VGRFAREEKMVSRREFYLSLAVVAAIALWIGSSLRAPGSSLALAAETQMLEAKPASFASVARRATPSVVNIFTTQHVRVAPFGGGKEIRSISSSGTSSPSCRACSNRRASARA
jgi:hypothetical protein